MIHPSTPPPWPRLPLVLAPGIDDSAADHWQSRWQDAHPRAVRTAPASFTEPHRDDWVRALSVAARVAGAPPLVAAHSLGCLAAVDWVARQPGSAVGLLLVALPDPSGSAFPSRAADFAPIRLARLDLPVIMVASDDDPYAATAFSQAAAAVLGARLVRVGRRGHLNQDSGLGAWPAGRLLLADLAAAATPGGRAAREVGDAPG